MTFRTSSISEAEEAYRVVGDLTIRGITQPVSLEATYNGSAVFPVDGSTHHGFSASGTIARSAFGISAGIPTVTDEVLLLLEAQFVQPADS